MCAPAAGAPVLPTPLTHIHSWPPNESHLVLTCDRVWLFMRWPPLCECPVHVIVICWPPTPEHVTLTIACYCYPGMLCAQECKTLLVKVVSLNVDSCAAHTYLWALWLNITMATHLTYCLKVVVWAWECELSWTKLLSHSLTCSCTVFHMQTLVSRKILAHLLLTGTL